MGQQSAMSFGVPGEVTILVITTRTAIIHAIADALARAGYRAMVVTPGLAPDPTSERIDLVVVLSDVVDSASAVREADGLADKLDEHQLTMLVDLVRARLSHRVSSPGTRRCAGPGME